MPIYQVKANANGSILGFATCDTARGALAKLRNAQFYHTTVWIEETFGGVLSASELFTRVDAEIAAARQVYTGSVPKWADWSSGGA